MLKKRFLFIDPNLVKKLNSNSKNSFNKNIYTWSRSSTILPFLVGKTLFVYNGKRHIPLFIHDKLLGYKLGDFIFTRFFKSHKKKDKIIKFNKKK